MHVIRILGYCKTDDLRKAAFLCGCIPIGCVPANSRFHGMNRSMSQHSASEDIEHTFVSPRILFRHVYRDSESGPQSEEADDQINVCFDE